MGDDRAAIVFTDPPYHVPSDGHAIGLGAIRHRAVAIAAGKMSRPAFAVFLAISLGHLAALSAGGALLHICIDWRHIGELLAAAARLRPGSKTSLCGSRTMPGWDCSVAVSTSLPCLQDRAAATATTQPAAAPSEIPARLDGVSRLESWA